jgi:hypothetical protein
MLLLAHPTTPCDAVRGFSADVVRGAGGAVRLEWRLDADLPQLRLPAAATVARADGLWRHTCFEAFLARLGSPTYCELNFSPSGEWAVYRFDGYRTGMRRADARPPLACWRRGPRRLQLEVELGIGEALGLAAGDTLRVALAAVIEESSGTMSYWALRHPAGPPDFHHADGFVMELPPNASDEKREASLT